MKYAKFFNLLAAVLVLSLGTLGCKPKKGIVTPVPGQTGGVKSGDGTSGIEKLPPANNGETPGVTGANIGAGGEIPQTGRFNPDAMNQDHEFFKANVVHFDLDRATIKSSESSKIDAVADYLKKNPTHAVQVEGHCDERGTEQYNLSLGERRALAVREYLVNAGIAAERAFTISYGESHPVEQGHNEGAWSKNRRAEFVLLTPK